MATLPDLAKSVLLLEDKALHIHLTCLSLAMGEQMKWINSMVEFHQDYKTYVNQWSDVLLRHDRLTRCLSHDMKGKTPLTYMHIAVVTRLSESYQHSVAGAKMFYDKIQMEDSLCRAKISNKSAKYLAYAMLADRAGDAVLRGWCLKAADALQTAHSREYHSKYCLEAGDAHLVLFHSHTASAKGATDKNQTLLASAHSFLARHFIIRAAAAIVDKHATQRSNVDNYEVVSSKCKALLDEAERLYCQVKIFNADALVSVVLHHSRIDDQYTDFRWAHVSHIHDAVLSYVSGIDVAVPDPYRSAFDEDLPNVLWNRALLLPRNDYSEQLVAYAAGLRHSLVSLHSRAELCEKNARGSTAAGHLTCADVWLHISSTATALLSEIIAAAVLLNASNDGADCVSWNVQQAKTKAVDEWIEFGKQLDDICAKLDLYRMHRDDCMRTCDNYPAAVRTFLSEIWERTIQIVTNGLLEIVSVLKVDGVYVLPGRDTSRLCITIRLNARNCALVAMALLNEASRHVVAARSAEDVGAVELGGKYNELAILVAKDFASIASAGMDIHTALSAWIYIHAKDLDKALEYFRSASNTCTSLTAAQLWREAYEQQLLVCEGSVRGEDTAAPNAAIKCIIRQIEQFSAPSTSPLLREMQQLEYRFAVSATKPHGRNVYWLSLARSVCRQACELLFPFAFPTNSPETARMVSLVARLRCAAMCYDALANTSFQNGDVVKPLVLSAKLLSLVGEDWGSTCEKICQFDVGISFLNDAVLALLAGTPHEHLVDELREFESLTTEPLREQVQALVELNRKSQFYIAAYVVAATNHDELGQRLWRAVGSNLRSLQELVYRQCLYLCDDASDCDDASSSVCSEYDRQHLQGERLQLAALSHDNGDDITSHCYEMASVDNTNGRRQINRHTECTQRYLDIIDSLYSNDLALTVLKVIAADRFRELADKNDNRRLESALLLHSESADARVSAYIAGQASLTEEQHKLLQVSDLLAAAAQKWEAAEKHDNYGPQRDALNKEAKNLERQADRIRGTFPDPQSL